MVGTVVINQGIALRPLSSVVQRNSLFGTTVNGGSIAYGMDEYCGTDGGKPAHVVRRLVACKGYVLTQSDGMCRLGTVNVGSTNTYSGGSSVHGTIIIVVV